MALVSADAARRMDDMYRHQRLVYDVSRRYYLLGRTTLIDGLAPPPEARILEVACGTAWNLVRAADRYPDARLYGFDISGEMLRSARRAVRARGLHGRIALAHGDVTRFDAPAMFGEEKFERVFISYSLSMIPGWPEILERCGRALAEGGAIHLVDFGQSEGLPPAFRRLLFAWLARFHVTPRADLEQRLARFAENNGFELAFARLYRGYAVHAVLKNPRR